MKKLSILLLTLLMLFAIEAMAYGYANTVGCIRYDGFGARADAMGGAFTAIADDGCAPYWNPAGISQLKVIALTADVGFIPDPEAMPGYDSYTIEGFYGITTNTLALNGSFKMYDGTKLDGISSHLVRDDYILTMATPLFGNLITIGGNLKYFHSFFNIYDESNDSIQYGEGRAWTYDLGFLIKPADFIRVGLVGRDITAPNIEVVKNAVSIGDVNYIKVNSSYTLGVALKPSKSTILAADLDIAKDNTTFHVGLEQTALWEFIALRAGVVKSLTNGNAPFQINAGAGLKLFGVYVDCALLGLENGDKVGIEVTAGFRY